MELSIINIDCLKIVAKGKSLATAKDIIEKYFMGFQKKQKKIFIYCTSEPTTKNHTKN